ncbi:MAG: glucuronate isomerase, partial [Microbacterium sp.]
RLFREVLSGRADAAERRAFRAHMLVQMARMSVDDGLVMTIHPGVYRNHSSATAARFGPDSGHDIPVATEFTRGLRPLLEKYGLERDFHLVLFAVDETTYSRELAPLAGFYPSVYVGAPWWFLDAPDAIARHRAAVTETAGFSRSSGFIDDTRAFLSIPARHDTSRRVDAGFLARLVVEGRIRLADAERIIEELVGAIPRKVFKL